MKDINIYYNKEKWPTLPLTSIHVRPRTYYALATWAFIIAFEIIASWLYGSGMVYASILADLSVLAFISFIMWCSSLADRD